MSYSLLPTQTRQGRLPSLGDVQYSNVLIGPGGSPSYTGDYAPAPTLSQSIEGWFSSSTVLPAVPNVLLAIGAVLMWKGLRR